VRVLNPSRGTFHPKLYVARHGDEIAAMIGSANLTSGLIANVEAGAILRGHRTAPPLRRLWELAESWWDHVDAVAWSPERTVAAREVLAPDLLTAVTAALAADAVVSTISDAKKNWVHDVTPDGVWVDAAGGDAARSSPIAQGVTSDTTAGPVPSVCAHGHITDWSAHPTMPAAYAEDPHSRDRRACLPVGIRGDERACVAA
jgi:hypothetical protein